MQTSSMKPGSQFRRGPTSGASVPWPASRWKTHLALPLGVLSVSVALLGYSARDALAPAAEVHVVPVVAQATADSSPQANEVASVKSSAPDESQIIAQAPGWVEPAPFPINVPALAEGVVIEVLALEGDRVAANQVMVRLVAQDASLALRAAQAELDVAKAEVAKFESSAESAESRALELEDQLRRSILLTETGGAPQAEAAQLTHRARAARMEVGAARAAVEAAKALVARRQVAVEEAALHLSRMEVRAPIEGVVLSRLVEPGSRVSLGRGVGSSEVGAAVVARLYDPAKLQARAEVPIAESARISVGAAAQITTEALPGRTLSGRVVRVVHEANLQRNTIQMKVSIEDPPPALRPEMPVRVRFHAAPAADAEQAGRKKAANDGRPGETIGPVSPGLRLVLPAEALRDRTATKASVWKVKWSDGGDRLAALTDVELGETDDGQVEIRAGLRVGDRVIVEPPPGLADGDRVRVAGER